MFSLLDEVISNVIDVGTVLIQGELPSQRQVVSLISDGLTIAAIADATGYAEVVIEQILED